MPVAFPQFQSHPALFLNDGAFDHWLTVKPAASNGTGIADVAFHGDSVMNGSQSTDFLNKSMKALIRAAILGGRTPRADFWTPADSVNDNAAWKPAGSAPWTINDTTHAVQSQGSWAGEVRWTGGMNNPAATFVDPYTGQNYDIVHGKNFGVNTGTWTFTMDAGAAQTVTLGTEAPNKVGPYFVSSNALSNLASASHTIVLTGQSGNNMVLVGGVTSWSGARNGNGFGFAHLGRSGAKAGSFNLTGDWTNTPVQLLAGVKPDGTYGGGFPAGADLVFEELGLNDLITTALSYASFPNALDLFIEQETNILNSFRRAKKNCSICIVVPGNPQVLTSDITSGAWANGIDWPQFAGAMFDLARTYDAALLNSYYLMGSTPVADGYCSASNPHPTDVFQALIAKQVIPLI